MPPYLALSSTPCPCSQLSLKEQNKHTSSVIRQRRAAWGIWAQILFGRMWEKPWHFPPNSCNHSIHGCEDQGWDKPPVQGHPPPGSCRDPQPQANQALPPPTSLAFPLLPGSAHPFPSMQLNRPPPNTCGLLDSGWAKGTQRSKMW